jgi:hypothetical protein
MPITVKQNTKKETVITISGKIDQEQSDQAMRYLQYLALTSKIKKVPQKVADELAANVKQGMAEQRRKQLAT